MIYNYPSQPATTGNFTKWSISVTNGMIYSMNRTFFVKKNSDLQKNGVQKHSESGTYNLNSL